ncbi:ATPase, T2SS/T4P/T4SS family [Paracandidimonas soli]|uniref:ATPase, T2SS/T4P/T4SS family n=1 Tax=Paracandidimonas soli TaxID=1917182 RepID=UPI00333FC48A
MLRLELCFEDGRVEPGEVRLPCEVGRAAACQLRLSGWRVARRHMEFTLRESGVFLEDYGSLSGTLLNGKRVFRHGPLQVGDEIVVGNCLLRIKEIHIPGQRDAAVSAPMETGEASYREPGRNSPEVGSGTSDVDKAARVSPGNDTGKDMPSMPPQAHAEPAVAVPGAFAKASTPGDFSGHGKRLHAALLHALDLRRHDIADMDDSALRVEAIRLLKDLMAVDRQLPEDMDRQALCRHIVDEAVGLGPLEHLLADPAISEIMVNRYDEIYIESRGRLHRHASAFSSESAVLGVIDRIVAPIGRRVDESSPMVDARLKDGSRVNAVIPPVALRGASLTIRKFFAHRLAMRDLMRMGSLDEAMSRFLLGCVRLRKNILVSGGTGSGKTTLLNVLSDGIPEAERIVTIEDAAELRLSHAHLVSLEARPANLEGKGRISIRDLVRNALRMRPDRIVVGECRGAEAFDMLAAMNTGHEGSLTTLHANSPRDALSRLETMILMAGMDLPLVAVREHIASSVDIIVQQARMKDGSRRLVSISEVTGMESGCIQLQELFRLEPAPEPGFRGCGVVPDWLADGIGDIPGMGSAAFSGFSPLPVEHPAASGEHAC